MFFQFVPKLDVSYFNKKGDEDHFLVKVGLCFLSRT